jgi:hypothetical protein
MLGITEGDWSFKKIRECDPCRAARLESCGSPDELVAALVQSIIKNDGLRIGVDDDSKCDRCRTIVQFRVTPELYDWFYNGRTGYRAQFWTSPEAGMKFNERILAAVVKALTERLPEVIPVVRRLIRRDSASYYDVGHRTACRREELLSSLKPEMSKIWIGEDIIRASPGPMTTWLTLLRYAKKLCVPKWAVMNPQTGETGEGLRAPFHCADDSWLDVKGVFLNATGEPDPIEPQKDRAQRIHNFGWK